MKALDICLRQNFHHLIRDSEKYLPVITKKGWGKLTFPIFANEFLSSPKQLEIGLKYSVFKFKHDHLCD